MKLRYLVPFFVLQASLLTQNVNTGPSKTQGDCSPAISGLKNLVTVNCSDPKKLNDIYNLLKTIHDNQVPMQQVMEKLNLIIDGMKALQPRHLTGEQIERLSNLLRPLAGSKVEILSSNTSDSRGYADDFAAVMNRAGWVQQNIDAFPPYIRPNELVQTHPKLVWTQADFPGVQIRLSYEFLHWQTTAQILQPFLRAMMDEHLMTEVPVTASPYPNPPPPPCGPKCPPRYPGENKYSGDIVIAIGDRRN